MGKIEKLKQDLKARPKTYNWQDVVQVLESVGYRQNKSGKTSGSRVRFVHSKAAPLVLHKPHPGNEMKRYMIKYIADKLESEELI